MSTITCTFTLKELCEEFEENKDIIVKLFKNVGNAMFIQACREGYLELVKLLIEHGADITINEYLGFRWASCNGHLEVVKLLIEHRADVKINNNEPIVDASEKGHLEIVKLLLEHGAIITDRCINNAKPHIKEYLLTIKSSTYYGFCSPSKLDIQLPDLLEIIKDNKYYYVYKYKYIDNCYVLDDQEKKFSILNSLNLENKVTLGVFLNLS